MARTEPRAVKLMITIAFRDGIERQMEVLKEFEEGLDRELFRREIKREINRLKGEFNKAQAEISTLQGRILTDPSQIGRDDLLQQLRFPEPVVPQRPSAQKPSA